MKVKGHILYSYEKTGPCVRPTNERDGVIDD